MYVFIDESGCAGFRLAHGSTSYFVIAMVIFTDREAMDRTGAAIKEIRKRTRHKSEFRFSKCSDPVRDQFFDYVQHQNFRIRALVVDKRKIHGVHLRTDTKDFHRHFIRQLLAHEPGLLTNARIRIDGSGDRTFRRTLNRYLRSHMVKGRIHSVVMKDSTSSDLIQLADMCAGAIHRRYKYQDDRKNAGRWYEMLKPRITDIWIYPER